MRIAIGQLWQETNTFNRNPTTLSNFQHWGVATGADLIKQFAETGEIGGFMSRFRSLVPDVEFTGLSRFACWPAGRVDSEAWSAIQASFRDQLHACGDMDAIFLALHGAIAAVDEHDMTGRLLAMARDIVGPGVPIVGSLDLHANITQLMVDSADALVGYHACPHIDTFETGERAASCLERLLSTGRGARMVWCKLPMIAPAEANETFTGPPAPLYRQAEALESRNDILSVGVYMAMPWLDVPGLGWAVTLTFFDDATDDHVAEFETLTDGLADHCWLLRHAMCDVERHSAADAVRLALTHDGPVVIGDGADATNSGSPGDSTHLLRELLAQSSIPGGALTFVVDLDVVHQATSAGIGATIETTIGGKFSPEYSDPIPLRATVEALLPVRFTLDGHIGKNFPIDMGAGAVLRNITESGPGDVQILVVEYSGPGSTPLLFEAANLDPRSCGIVIAKSPAGFRADYGPFVKATYLADCPGCADRNLESMPFENVTHPLWPLDNIASRHKP